MKRRKIALGVIFALCILTAPSASDAQHTAKVYRIGYLGITTYGHENDAHNCPKEGSPNWQAFMEGLRDRGYIPGRNLAIECRWTEDQDDQASPLATELVSLAPDIIVANGTRQVRAAKQASSTIPIIMYGVIDPVGRGLVANLAHPGGNVTGLADALVEMEGKRLQFLKEIAPKVSRVAVLYRSGRGVESWMRYLEPSARALALNLQAYPVQNPTELADAFAAMTKAGEEVLYVVPTGIWEMGDSRQRMVEFAAQNRLPAIYQDRGFVEAGGLMSYGVDEPAIRRRIGIYVDKILKGANPGELPVEQPTNISLVINLKTATALGLSIPPTLLVLADEVIN
jgi:putative tryptophan/tyrosine transport system substrate-binding protein